MSSPRRTVVTVGGTDFTGDTLANVQIEMGGRTTWEQSVAGLARIIINQEDPGILIGDTFTIEIESPEGVAATGGTVTTYTSGGIDYIVHTFTSDGTFTVTSPGDVDYLIVAGGGGGGSNVGAGGGAGGLLAGTATVNVGTFSIVVGAGGASRTGNGIGNDGSPSSAFGLTALGGGGGGGGTGTTAGRPGGSGGGGSRSGAGGAGTAGQGNDGGASGGANTAGGGGGAGSVGAASSATAGGDGGDGLLSSITGTPTMYAGGGGGMDNTSPYLDGVGGAGGGGDANQGGNAQSGEDGKGGGGGGTRAIYQSGAGGSGVVIIRYPDPTQRLFTGVVDSTSASITEIGPLWDVTASGPLTRLGRRELTGIIAADTEGDQIALLAQDGLGQTWEVTGGTWAEQTRTWDGFAVDTSAIDQPGLYALAAIDDLPANVADAMTTAAFSGSGWLYETRHGLIGYADSTHRENLPDTDYITIPGDVIGRNEFITVTQESDIANVVVVTYDGGDVEAKAADSIQIYGRWDRDYTTTLANQSAAEQFATRRLQLEGSPRLNLAGAVRIPLADCTDELLDQLIHVERNYGIVLEGVPTYLATEGIYRGFVEGYVWNLDPIDPTLDLFLSEYSLSNFGLRWAAAGPTQWNQVGASLTWNDATEALA